MASAAMMMSREVGEAMVAAAGLEQKKFDYFASISPMARRIMLERQKIREKYGPRWERLEPREQEEIIDNWMVEPQIRSRYNLHRDQKEETVSYPRLQLQTGQKVVHFGEEDITWQDEHSAPFSWETKSQMEFNFASTAASEQSEQRQPVKASQANHQPKTSQGGQPIKPLQNGKTPSLDGLAQVRKEESSSFWKLSTERSRLEREQSDYQCVTPSQIKSMEKGEKPLPSYMRQESLPKEKDENKSEKPWMKKQERIINTNVSSVFIDLDRPRTSQPSVGVLDDFTRGHSEKSPDTKTVSKESEDEERDDSCASDAPFFSQINTSNSILKTGFDFLDNW
ncbi:uncharacterized protein C1orf198 homolog [Scyliorhinus torazame]